MRLSDTKSYGNVTMDCRIVCKYTFDLYQMNTQHYLIVFLCKRKTNKSMIDIFINNLPENF